MSMQVLTGLQTAGIFGAYLLTSVGLPAFVFGGRLKGHRRLERFVLYFTIGNFYMMNLVFLLQLLKISCPATLILFTAAPALGACIRLNRISVKKLTDDLLCCLKKISRRYLGMKTVRARIYSVLRKKVFQGIRFAGFMIFRRTFDCLLLLLFFGLLFWLYGINLLQEYGYKASDMPVHNYWINALGENHIFVAGVYPHGFHCVIYYLRAVFVFDTYNILRVFGFVQTVMVHLMLYCFLKLCCRTRYAPYIGTLLYTGSSIFAVNTYSRFAAALPQEFGMLFIFPSVYYGFRYFEVRGRELAAPKEKPRRFRRQPSHLYLAGFAMSFSMTLAVHFYGTMIAGLFCAAMAIGYGFWFFRKGYFWNVVGTCLLSVLIAVLPMAAAYAGGTPLQGSLKWGMNVITGAGDQKESDAASAAEEPEENSDGGAGQNPNPAPEIKENGSPAEAEDPEHLSAKDPVPEPSLREKVTDYVKPRWTAIYRAIAAAVLRLPESEWIYWLMDGFLMLIGLGILLFLLKQRVYGAMLSSAGIYMLLLGVMLASHAFGLPALMDSNRGSIYFAYSIPIAVSFLLDAVLVLLFLPVRFKFPMHALSLGCVFLVLSFVWQEGLIKEPRNTKAQEMNEAITCMENIIRNEKDFTWTIVSANDELRMGTDHGYHYETITFLQDMEGKGAKAMIRIPTPAVYIFIEKIPLDYYGAYEKSGQTVSAEGASHVLPPSVGIQMYQGEQRWMLMSRMYYWAQEFQRQYPNEMDIYLETDQFVCYRIEQNPYRLYNFAIDYGYNTQDQKLTEETDHGIF